VPLAEATIATHRLDAYLVDVEAWLKASRLRLNPSKAAVMWLGSSQESATVWLDDGPVLSSHIRLVDIARNLGVVHSQLSMSAYFSAVCCGGYYQLLQLRPLKRCMTDEAIKTLTHAFICSRLDYCNVLYCSIA